MSDVTSHVLVAVALVLWGGLANAENWKSVKPDALRALFAGKEFGDGAHFAYRFRSDGVFSGTELGKDVRGAWRVKGSEVCWKWTLPPGGEECYDVQTDGATVRLLTNGSETRYGTLKP